MGLFKRKSNEEKLFDELTEEKEPVIELGVKENSETKWYNKNSVKADPSWYDEIDEGGNKWYSFDHFTKNDQEIDRLLSPTPTGGGYYGRWTCSPNSTYTTRNYCGTMIYGTTGISGRSGSSGVSGSSGYSGTTGFHYGTAGTYGARNFGTAGTSGLGQDKIDRAIDYTEYIASNLDKAIQYSEYLAEHVDNAIKYSEYIAEHVDNTIRYSEYITENLDKKFKYIPNSGSTTPYKAKEVKRVISEEDPYGEEDWEN